MRNGATRGFQRATLTLAIAAFAAAGVAVADGDRSTHTATYELQWMQLPFGPKATPVSGDFGLGRHVTYVKFEAGMRSALHTHTHDYVGIVLTGTTRHWTPGRPETEKDLPSGSHWFIPGGLEHVSECLPGVECLMAIYQQEPLDFLPVGDSTVGGGTAGDPSAGEDLVDDSRAPKPEGD